MTTRIAINGLGRIGRMVLRGLFEQKNHPDIALVALNAIENIDHAIHMLRYDSTHGPASFDIKREGDFLKIGDATIHCLNQRDPALLPWRDLGIDIVLECSGKFKKHAQATQHITAGAKRVLISAPCDDSDAMIVYGVNHHKLTDQHKIISAASCTTNCLAPVAKILLDCCGIKSGFMTTIHAYTSDQALLDQRHKDLRRARSAALSLVPTSTGAARAISHIIPELAGKLNGTAIRVPVPNISMVDFVFIAEKNISVSEINQAMQQAAATSMQGVLAYNDQPLVSIDFTHHPASAIFDATGTEKTGDDLVRVVAWYDNEWGYSMRMLDLTQYIA